MNYYRYIQKNNNKGARPVGSKLPRAAGARSVRTSDGGYIALISAIIISFILIGLTFSVSSGGYFSRFNVANSEYKRISLGLSESCVNLALLKVAQNYKYDTLTDPAYDAVKGGVVVPVGAQDCLIKSVTYGPEVAGRKAAYVSTQADYLGSFSNVKVAATVASTTYTTISKGTLTVQLQVTNDSGGTKLPGDFTVNLAGGNPTLTTFAGSASGVTVIVDAGVIVNESIANYFGYIPSYSPSCNVALSVGQSATCTIYLNDPATTATLTLIANVKNNNGGTKSPANFPLSLDGVPVTTGIAVSGLSVGAHTATTSPTPSGYTVSNWGYDCAANGTITLAAGENKTCIVNYDDIPPPAPACADTVVMIDRTGSLSADEVATEASSTKALLDLYSKIASPPQVGIGRFYGPTSAAADIIPGGQLTSSYGHDATTSIMGPVLPNGPAAVSPATNSWTTPINALGIDSFYSSAVVNGKELALGLFGFPVLPAGSTVTDIQVVVDGKAINAIGAPTDSPQLVPTGLGNYPGAGVGWTAIGAANTWTAVASGVDTSYIAGTSNNSTSTFAVNLSSIPANSIINAVNFVVLAAGSASCPVPGCMRLVMEKGTGAGQQKFDNAHTLTSSTTTIPYNFGAQASTTNLVTGLPWSSYGTGGLTELSLMRFGVARTNTTVVQPRVAQLYVMVNYTPPSSAASVSVSLSWNGGVSTTTSQNYTLSNVEASTTLVGTWGRTWTSGDLADGAFSVRVKNTSPSGPTAAINYVTVKVLYSVPATGLYLAINDGIVRVDPTPGGTDINSAISVGNGEVSGVRHDSTKAKVLIILSDGLPTTGATFPTSQTEHVLNAADTAKLSGTKIYFLHFGDGSGNNLSASTSSGVSPVMGHQPGSHNDAGKASGNVPPGLANTENTDGDNLFMSPTFAQMQAVFEQVGTAVCPAAGAASTPPPTTGNLVVITHVINDNGGVKQAVAFTMQLSGTGLNPSINNFTGVDTPGMSVTVSSTTPGNPYSVVELGFSGYVPTYGAGCSGTIGGGETKTCTVTNDDNAPAPPPPPPPPPDIDIGPWVEATSTSPGP